MAFNPPYDKVQGYDADGAATTVNPVQVGGKDGSGNIQSILTGSDGSVKVDGSGATQPVSGTVTANLGTISTAATSAKQDTGNTSLSSIDGKLSTAKTADFDSGAGTDTVQMTGIALPASGGAVAGGTSTNPIQVSMANTGANATAVKVDGSAATQPVSGTISAAQSGTWTVQPGNTANTTAWKVDGSAVTQPVSGTVSITSNSAVNVAQVNGVTTQTGTGTAGTGTQRVAVASDSSVVLAAGSNLAGKVGLDQTTPGTTNAVSVAQIGANTVATAGVNGTLAVGGNVATNVAIGTNPINLGAQGVSSENTAVTANRMAQLVSDLVGKLIVLPYANPENFVNGTTAAITDTTSTSVIASAGGSLRNYVTSILVTNSHASVGTFVKILDGSTIIYEGYAAAAGGGFSASLPVALRGTAATAVNAQCVTTGANVIVSCAGYKGV